MELSGQRKAMLGAAFLSAAGVASVLWFSSHHHPTVPVLEPSVVDVGTLSEGTDVKVHSRLKNLSNETISISKVGKSCGCTEVELAETKIGPGQASDVVVRIVPPKRATGFKVTASFDWEGKKSRRGSIDLTVLGGLDHPLSITPEHFGFGEVSVSAPERSAVFHVKRGTANLKWDSLRAFSERLSTQVQKISDDEFLVTVVLDPARGHVGHLNEPVKISLYDGEDRLNYDGRINVTAHVTGNIEVKPGLLYLGVCRLGVPSGGQFYLFAKNPATTVVNVQSTTSTLQAKFERNDDGKMTFSYVFTGDRIGDISGKLLVSLLTPEPLTVEVPFIGNVNSP